MASIEPTQSTALVPIDQYKLKLRELDQLGRAQEYQIVPPTTPEFYSWPLTTQVWALKMAAPWDRLPVPTVIVAIAYARNLNLDILAGDVYVVDGRFAVSAEGKIRYARNKIPNARHVVEVTDGPEIEIPWKTKEKSGVWKGPNSRIRVSIFVDKADPLPATVYETTLKEWFNGSNAAWQKMPLYMLRMNALSKAYMEVVPMGVDPDSVPPVETFGNVIAGQSNKENQ